MKKISHLTLIALRHSSKHPLQSLLLILGVALGVGMIIAIDLANSSASEAFTLSTNSIAGKATHQIVASADGVPSALYRSLRARLGWQEVAPVVTDLVILEEANQLPMTLLGVDPFAEPPFRSYLQWQNDEGSSGSLSLEALTRLLLEPNSVIISEDLAERFDFAVEEVITLKTKEGPKRVTIIGLVGAANEASRRALDGLILSDISTAQEVLGQVGYLSYIDLILSPSADIQPLLDILPNDVQIERKALRNETLDQMLSAFELNLSALSLLGLVVGMFLIYNTISFSVVQRRPVLGALRCLGVTRREIFGLVLSEALVLSAIGTMIGLGIGIILGRGLVGLVSRTINDLFFTATVQGVSLTVWTIYKGVVIGLGAGLIAAFVPAFEATTVPPSLTLKRSVGEARLQRLLSILSVSGLVLLGLGLLLLQQSQTSVVIGFAALFTILLGMALLTPWLTQLVMHLIQALMPPLGVIGLMAPRDILRSLSRTAVTIAALMVAVSVIIGVSIMITSFRGTVVAWLNDILIADIFISPANPSSPDGGQIPAEFVDELRTYPKVRQIGLLRGFEAISPAYGAVRVNAISPSPADDLRGFLWHEGTRAEAFTAFDSGAIFISEVFARREGLPVDAPSEIVLITASGAQTFRVVGVFYDYATPSGLMMMRLKTYQTHWADDGIFGVSLYLSPDTNVDEMLISLQDKFAGPYQLSLVSNRTIKEQALIVFDRTFTITSALRLLATVVAFIGVLSALMSLQLERTRELGTLRATGMTLRQLWSLTFLETGFIGLTAGLIAIPAGWVLSLVLIYVINLRSFGWSLQIQASGMTFLTAMLVALIASLLAGIYPSWRLSKLAIATALREE